MSAPQVRLESAETLTFISDWLSGADNAQLAASFRRFVGADGYDLTGLRADLARHTFLLGGDDGEQLFGHHDGEPRHHPLT